MAAVKKFAVLAAWSLALKVTTIVNMRNNQKEKLVKQPLFWRECLWDPQFGLKPFCGPIPAPKLSAVGRILCRV